MTLCLCLGLGGGAGAAQPAGAPPPAATVDLGPGRGFPPGLLGLLGLAGLAYRRPGQTVYVAPVSARPPEAWPEDAASEQD